MNKNTNMNHLTIPLGRIGDFIHTDHCYNFPCFEKN